MVSMGRGIKSVDNKYTGTFPKSPKSPKDFREREMGKQKGFAGSVPDTGFKEMREDKKIDPFPEFKSGGRISNAGEGHEGHNVECDVNVGSDLAPTKARPFKGYAANTKPPLGRALPVRGEHNENDRSNTQS